MENNWKMLAKNCHEIPPSLRFGAEDEVLLEEIGDGNLNDVSRLLSKHPDGQIKNSLIVKHSVPYIKCLGEGYPLTEKRIEYEYKALVKFHTLSPGSVPQPFLFNPKTHSVFMEDLQGYVILRSQLMDGIFHMKAAENIAQSLSTVHCQLHVNNIGKERLMELDKEFDNTSMVALTEQYVFSRPFTHGDETNKCSPAVEERLDSVYKDQQVLQTANKMLKLFLEKKECLLHGDLHTGSIMVKGADARMIDVEFAFVGPASFDVGMLLANFIFTYYRHMAIEENNDQHRQFALCMIDACKCLVRTYLTHNTAIQLDQHDAFMVEVAGFAGCEIVRRLVGVAHNADLENMPLAEQDCLGAGVRLLQAAHRIHDVDRLLVIALMLA